ncbi:MAG: transposase [Gammaproteobacteria bacterium]|nr:transposase [Gammaproteobacteria bacterium]
MLVPFLLGTHIYTDEWLGYNGLVPLGYQHSRVNHSRNFVDPVTGAHTQRIENTWAQAKQKYKRIHGTSRELFDSYLYEFMWRKLYSNNIFGNMVFWITHYFPI